MGGRLRLPQDAAKKLASELGTLTDAKKTMKKKSSSIEELLSEDVFLLDLPQITRICRALGMSLNRARGIANEAMRVRGEKIFALDQAKIFSQHRMPEIIERFRNETWPTGWAFVEVRIVPFSPGEQETCLMVRLTPMNGYRRSPYTREFNVRYDLGLNRVSELPEPLQERGPAAGYPALYVRTAEDTVPRDYSGQICTVTGTSSGLRGRDIVPIASIVFADGHHHTTWGENLMPAEVRQGQPSDPTIAWHSVEAAADVADTSFQNLLYSSSMNLGVAPRTVTGRYSPQRRGR